MAKSNTPEPTNATMEPAITLGPVAIPESLIRSLSAQDYSRGGVVLTNERIKVTIPNADGIPVLHTLSLYVQRDPMTDDERTKVAAVKAEKEAGQKARKLEESERLAREKQEAFRLGQEGMVSAIKNVRDLAAGLSSLQALVGTQK